MSSNTTIYNISFTTNGGQVFATINNGLSGVREATKQTTKVFGDCYKALLSVSLVADSLNQIKQSVDNLIAPGASLNANMLELSAITGVTGDGLKAIELAARDTAKTFGTSAVDNVEAYKMMLSQLSPEIANNAEAMKMMGETANILSKQMGGDTVAATDVLNTSLNQFGVSMDDPIAAAKVMADMMNVMSAAAQQGSAELPQIKQALEQVGMVAKTTGLSFAETNAYIQLLDQAGKKGSEGGVALRNVLATLSEGRFTSKLAAEGLEQAGISVNYLADTSIPLHDRLKTLRKIQGDTALMTKVFGKENMAAAIAMINTADEAEAMSKAIVGTQSAVEQAEVIMSGYNEKIARTKAWFDDLKISVFNLTESFTPYISSSFSAIETMDKLTYYGHILMSTYRAISLQKIKTNIQTGIAVVRRRALALWTGIGSVANKIYAHSLDSVRTAFFGATAGATSFQIALNALGIGLIILAIAGLVVGLKHLYKNSRKFREILGYIGGAGKAIFHNIGVYVDRLWNLVFKPIALYIQDTYTQTFSAIWEFAASTLSWIENTFISLWNTIKSIFQWVVSLIFNVWSWIKETFGSFAAWVEDAIINPIRDAFSNIWDWIVGLLDKIMNKMSGVLAPIRELWNRIFSSEGTINIHEAGKAGANAAGEQFDKEQNQKNQNNDKTGKPQEVKIVDDSHKSIFDVGKGSGIKTSTIGGVAAEKTKNKNVGSKGNSSAENGNKVRNLTIGKFMDNFNVYMNHQQGVDRHQLLQAVREVFMTASADFSGVNE
ncbi:Phage-related minor tail protein [Candidatus Ornithobacterium hominis]|uniref:phage tail tape measure protein n=1 Tax=Candidatus Ornithobacterium hominis TaxID=2497989 RepID=UPI000E5A42E5|nr:phage tail tape measure protein [Candidatus Ornithobacterium hominis]SZD72752.1 Phage-related minor tail protein [Candidatus Ornithobacterium hominis]